MATPGDIKIEVPTGHYFITPLMLQKYAADFLAAAQSVKERSRYTPVRYYLVCHAIELALKALLRARGSSDKDIRNLSHDLNDCLVRARANGLDSLVLFTSIEQAELRKANVYYVKKGFEYFTPPMLGQLVNGFKDVPDLSILLDLANRLIEGVRQTCFDAASA